MIIMQDWKKDNIVELIKIVLNIAIIFIVIHFVVNFGGVDDELAQLIVLHVFVEALPQLLHVL